MTIIKQRLFQIALALLFSNAIHALPTGAGNCPGGRAAVGVTHLTGNVTEGTLEQGGIVVIVGDNVLSPTTVTQLPLGQDLYWSINATKRPMRGFLMRAEDRSDDGGKDTSQSLNGKEDKHVQLATTVCVSAFGVGGVTHTNNNQKRSVSGTFRMDEVVKELQLDVTIVAKNRNGRSIFYYSGFVVEITDATDATDDGDESDRDDMGDITVDIGDDAMETGSENNDVDGPALALRASSCTTESPCGQCEGDCNKNGHCAEGLECFYRPDLTPIPGCSGEGEAGHDYCYLPQNDTLRLRSVDCSEERPCDACQGACSNNNDCGDGLSCFLRPDNTPVPGCKGSGIAGRNYCFETPEPENNLEMLVLLPRDCNNSQPCDMCQGECFKNRDCNGDLECFFRPDLTPVPGCSETNLGVSGRNYCFQPPKKNTLVLKDTPCTSFLPCRECEGECTSDDSCYGQLKCKKRPDAAAIIGCSGTGVSGKNYCYDESKEIVDANQGEITIEEETEVDETDETEDSNELEDVETTSLSPTPKPTRRPGPNANETVTDEVEEMKETETTPLPTPKPTRRPRPNANVTVPDEVEDIKDSERTIPPTLQPTKHPRPNANITVTDEVEQTTETEPTLLPTPKPTRRNRPYANTDSTATDGVEEETKEQQEIEPTLSPSPKPTRRSRPNAETGNWEETKGPEEVESTMSPTLKPTKRPRPSASPTKMPMPPTLMPTKRPRPSASPTKMPTPAPTSKPTLRSRPTPSPTVQPTTKPTSKPTARPTPRPTIFEQWFTTTPPAPTGQPTLRPTLKPTPRPRPTAKPTMFPESFTPYPTPTPDEQLTLKTRETACTSQNPCEECYGDCNTDAQCAGILQCFQRPDESRVPGCQGRGVEGVDYCAINPNAGNANTNRPMNANNNNPKPPTRNPTPQPYVAGTDQSQILVAPPPIANGNNNISPPPPGNNDGNVPNINDASILELQDRNAECTQNNPCGECMGDCDDDNECSGILRCFFRPSFEAVPGCGGQGTAGTDYCAFDPRTSDVGTNNRPENDNPNLNQVDSNVNIAAETGRDSSKVLVTRSQLCSVNYPCGECQGDCSGDDDCAGGLQCYFRFGTEPVPGCIGTGVGGRDYCAWNRRDVRRRQV